MRIERFASGLEHGTFVRDDKTTDSVVRNLEVLGEAANRLPAEFRNRHPEVPWSRIVGLRNRIVHEYFDVDLDLWTIVSEELPSVKEQLRKIKDTLLPE